MTEDNARERLDLDVLERRLLVLGEVEDLCLGILDLLLAQAEGGRRIIVKLLRQGPNRLIPPRLDIPQNLLDGRPNLRIIRSPIRLAARGLKMPRQDLPLTRLPNSSRT